jgi:hypothetical protein
MASSICRRGEFSTDDMHYMSQKKEAVTNIAMSQSGCLDFERILASCPQLFVTGCSAHDDMTNRNKVSRSESKGF